MTDRYDRYRRHSKRRFEGIPEPEGHGAFHGDARFQLRDVVTDKKRYIEVAEPTPEDPDAKEKIGVPIITKVDALVWSWDSTQRRWLTRLEWEERYGPADAPEWQVYIPPPPRPGRKKKRESRDPGPRAAKWKLIPATPTVGLAATGGASPVSAPTPQRASSTSARPLASKHDVDRSHPHWLAQQVQADRGKEQRAETLRIREERATRRTIGARVGPIRPSDIEAYRTESSARAPTHALTLFPHWAHAVMWLGKDNEIRDWAPDTEHIGERIAIHAGARLADDWWEQLKAFSLVDLRAGQRPGPRGQPPVPFVSLASDRVDRNLRTSSIIGTVVLADVTPVGDKYLWRLVDPRPAHVPNIKGDRGLWPLPPMVSSQLRPRH